MAKKKTQIPKYGTITLKGMDIYAKVKYNKPEELFDVVNQAFIQDK